MCNEVSRSMYECMGLEYYIVIRFHVETFSVLKTAMSLCVCGFVDHSLRLSILLCSLNSIQYHMWYHMDICIHYHMDLNASIYH